MSLLLVLFAASGCPGTGEPDGGSCPASGDPAVIIGQTGLELVPFEEGDPLPAWQRPQGGIGTRINVGIDGYGLDDELAFLGFRIEARPTESAQPPPGELGGPCRDPQPGPDAGSGPVDGGAQDGGSDGGPGEEPLPLCDFPIRCSPDDICELEVAGSGYTSFPRLCRDEGGLLAPEVPIRFRTFLTLDDVDGLPVTLSVEVEDETGASHTDQVDLVLERSDFIEPETFDPREL